MKPSEPIFLPSDFDMLTNQQAADIANSRIESLLGPEVFGAEGTMSTKGVYLKQLSYNERREDWHTHTARLFNVQPIAKVECEHNHTTSNIYGTNITCNECGRKLKIKFEVIDD